MASSLKAYANTLVNLSLDELDGFVELLKADGVILQVETIIAQAEKIIAEQTFNKTVTVTSAAALGSEDRHKLYEKVKELVELPIIKEVVDPKLIAGVKIELPHGVIDGSLAHRLNTLKTTLTL